MRARSSLITEPTPPPSPIPTGKGSRSASNEPFDRFLDRSLRVPALASPETSIARRSVLTMVDLRSLVSGAGDSVYRILRSAKDFAAFRIVGHGISVDELRSLIGENERTLGSLERESGFGQRILWIGSWHKGLESGRRFIGDEGYRDRISVNMKHVASRLEAIAEQLNQILFKNSGEKSEQKRMFESKEYVLSLYRHYNNHQSFIDRNRVPPSHEKESQLCGDEYFLSLHLPFENCQIYVQSEMQLLPFEAGPETLVVTFGKQI